VLDVSCGSGLFTRRMAASGLYPLWWLWITPETMLRQTKEFHPGGTGPSASSKILATPFCQSVQLLQSLQGLHSSALAGCLVSPIRARHNELRASVSCWSDERMMYAVLCFWVQPHRPRPRGRCTAAL